MSLFVGGCLALLLGTHAVYGDHTFDSFYLEHELLELSDVADGDLETNLGLVVFDLSGLHSRDVDACAFAHSANFSQHAHLVRTDNLNLAGMASACGIMPLNRNPTLWVECKHLATR